jgi:hypothetical protein
MKIFDQASGRSLITTAKSVRRLVAVSALAIVSAFLFISEPVWAAPTIFPSNLPDAEVDVFYTTTLVAAPVTGSTTWQITSGSLPPGLSLNAGNGVISGTPTTVGSYNFFVDVTDDIGTSPQQGFNITVTQTPLSFLTTTLPDATEDDGYSEDINVTGGTSPYTWDIVSGSLPDGLSLSSSTGEISGTPDEDSTGSYSFTVEVTDSSISPLSAQRSFNLFVEEGLFASTISIGSGLAAGDANVYVDGDWVAALGGGQSVSLDLDLGTSPQITVEDMVTNPTNASIRFVAEDDSIEVRESSPNAHFSYFTEYLLDVSTNPSLVGGVTEGGWFREGEVFLIGATTQVPSTSDTRYQFSHWQLPTGGTVTNESFGLTVTAPGSVVAHYDTEYFLEFVTDPADVGGVTGSGWYAEGYDLRTSASEVVDDTPDTQFRFSHWELPTGETVRDENLNLEITAPGSITANYDTYYRLVIASPYGASGEGTWHKAGSEANWELEASEVAMPGAFGVLGGRLNATRSSGIAIMDGPTLVTVDWEADYTRPAIFISLIALAVGLSLFFGLRRRKPQPVPAPQPQTTVVMIGDSSKPQTTREQLLEKLSDLLENYEEEIKLSVLGGQATKELGKGDQRMLPTPEDVVDAESTCGFRARKLLRVVTGGWTQGETKIKPAAADGTAPESQVMVWTREIYNEWEILSCFLPTGHAGNHQGNFRIVYTLLNTITEEKVFSPGEAASPPDPHFTDSMPEVEIAKDQVITFSELPTEELP